MTAPLTPPPPPHEQSSHRAWPPAGHLAGAHDHTVAHGSAYVGTRGSTNEDGPGMKTEVREAAVVTVTLTLCGVLLGVLWNWLAPRVPLVGDVVSGTWVVYLKDTEGEQSIGVEGTFTLLALAFGAVSAFVVFLVRRRGGVPLVVALGLGGLLGSLLAWRVGVWLGPAPDVLAHAKEVGKGVTFPAPLELAAKGVLLAWSFSGLLVHLGLTALFGPRDPEPVGQGPHGEAR
ncbi:AAA family ATPase [Streptomyces sp. NPDC047706]|uniref:AAA family ATPase n=1 Tax=Streptomyces sp. NPDC047706 TaxID=3365486 RepID=UPI00371FA853